MSSVLVYYSGWGAWGEDEDNSFNVMIPHKYVSGILVISLTEKQEKEFSYTKQVTADLLHSSSSHPDCINNDGMDFLLESPYTFSRFITKTITPTKPSKPSGRPSKTIEEKTAIIKQYHALRNDGMLKAKALKEVKFSETTLKRWKKEVNW